MKKLFSILFVLLLIVGCGSKNSTLASISDNDILKNMDNVTSVMVYNENYTLFTFIFDDDDNFGPIMDEVKKLNAVKEEVELTGDALHIDLNTEDTYVSLALYENGIAVTDSEFNETVYSSKNSSKAADAIFEVVKSEVETFETDGELLFDYNGLEVYLEEVNTDELGNHTLEIQFNNNTDADYEIVLNSIIDGVDTKGFSSCIVLAEDFYGYFLDTQDAIYETFTGKPANSISYYFDIYEYDDDTYDTEELVYTSEVIELFDNGSEKINLDNPVFEDDYVRIYNILEEEEMYTRSNFYIENKTNEDISVSYNCFVANEERIEDIYPERATNLRISANSSELSLIPIYTFDYDTESGEVSYLELESLKLELEVKDSEYNVVDSTTVVLK